ncbi:MAG: hypothetical protein IJN64_10900 [Lachnospiraceae bacterium]|nr:hypothetical protein [Lachnospiraceae bacterium]
MHRKILIDNIVNHLHEDELLNKADSSSVENLLKDVRAVVEYELRNYKILVGEVY